MNETYETELPVRLWMRALLDSDKLIRECASLVLENLRENEIRHSISDVIGGLRYAEREVRQAALNLLVKVEDHWTYALPALSTWEEDGFCEGIDPHPNVILDRFSQEEIEAAEEPIPLYDGHPLPYWITQLKSSPALEQRQHAEQILWSIGPEAHPYADDLELLTRSSLFVEKRIGIITLGNLRSEGMVDRLLDLIPSEPDLVGGINVSLSKVTSRCGGIIADGILELWNLLPFEIDDWDANQTVIANRRSMIWLWRQIGPPAKNAVTVLKELVESENEDYSLPSLAALLYIEPENERWLNYLKLRTERFNYDNDTELFYLLRDLGSRCYPLLSVLEAQLEHPDNKWKMIKVFIEMGEIAKHSVPALLGFYEEAKVEDELDLIVNAVVALAVANPDSLPKELPQDFFIRLQSTSSDAPDVIKIAPQLKNYARELVPLMCKSINHRKQRVEGERVWVDETDFRFTYELFLEGGLFSFHRPLCIDFIEALGKFGPLAIDALPELERAAQDKRLDVRQAATRAIQKIKLS